MVDDPVDVVLALVNTRAIVAADPYAREDLDSPSALAAWWARHGISAGAADLADVLDVREGLRALLARNNGAEAPGDAEAIARLDAVAAGQPLRFSPVAGLVPLAPGSPLAELLGAVAVLTRDRATWTRLKVCRDPHCREAFRDTTRSRTRTWCSMEVCGSRAKQRTFAARHRPA